MIISITGKIGSGKDTIARMIQEYTKDSWEVRKFAGKLKQIASILTGVSQHLFEDQEFKKLDMSGNWGMTYREFLQKLGTDALRDNLHKEVWINALFSEQRDRNSNWIITDTRFPNEYDACKKHDAVMIKVVRPGSYTGNHASEISLDHISDSGWDFIIINDGTLEDLQIKVSHIMIQINDSSIWKK